MRIGLSSIGALAAALALAPLAACELDVPDLDNPPLDDLLNNPTRVDMESACTGLLIANRGNYAQANGFVVQLGILGREAYNFDQADPRFIGELLEGSLQRGSPFGGNFWTGPYAAIRLANIIQRATDRVPDYSPADKAGVLGFSKTIEALDLLEVAVTRDTNGGVIDTDRELSAELAPIVGRDMMYAEIARLLDEAAADLGAAGEGFAFSLTQGYDGFDSPSSFLELNRALAARVAVYRKQYTEALTLLMASFIDDTATSVRALETGVYHTYSIGAGDTSNGLINPNIFAHPSVQTGAATAPKLDERFSRKVFEVEDPGAARGLASNLKFATYTGPGSPVPIIRNEELLLLRAEARYFTGDVMGAMTDLNQVRTVSGGLDVLPAPPAGDDAAFVTLLLYERRYSLLFEGGHRWIDVRRFDRVMDLPLDMPTGDDPAEHFRNIRYPIPLAECDARPGEPACMLGSR